LKKTSRVHEYARPRGYCARSNLPCMPSQAGKSPFAILARRKFITDSGGKSKYFLPALVWLVLRNAMARKTKK
ncbi:hypothetical protein BgiMline_035657, partial [Biomphalaria glabrata]